MPDGIPATAGCVQMMSKDDHIQRKSRAKGGRNRGKNLDFLRPVISWLFLWLREIMLEGQMGSSTISRHPARFCPARCLFWISMDVVGKGCPGDLSEQQGQILQCHEPFFNWKFGLRKKPQVLSDLLSFR